MHVVLRINPLDVTTWSAEDVAIRWVRLFSATVNGEVNPLACRSKEQDLLSTAERLEICRQRLGQIPGHQPLVNRI